MIKFYGENLSGYKVSILDSSGLEVLKSESIDKEISLENLKKGIFVYILTDKNGNKETGKIIKE